MESRKRVAAGNRFVQCSPLNKGPSGEISTPSYGDGNCLCLVLLPSRSLGLVDCPLRSLLLLFDVLQFLLHILRLVKCDASMMTLSAHAPRLWGMHIYKGCSRGQATVKCRRENPPLRVLERARGTRATCTEATLLRKVICFWRMRVRAIWACASTTETTCDSVLRRPSSGGWDWGVSCACDRVFDSRADMRLDAVLVLAILAFLARFSTKYNAALSSSDGRGMRIPALRVSALDSEFT